MDTTAATDPPVAASRLRVSLLGRFAVEVDGIEWPASAWSNLRAMHLVQLLGLQPGRRTTREQVIDALWPQMAPQAGAANLRKAVFHARQVLGRHDAIAIHAGELVLWPNGPVEIDAETFEREARAALRLGDPAACATAAGFYGGDLLPGARYEAWAEPAREGLRARHLELLRVSAQWERLALLDATNEIAHRALMQQALASGNRAAALHWYSHVREALQHQLGVMPDDQTQALHERCLSGLGMGGPVFTGRPMELAHIAAWLGQPRDERPHAIALRAPAGIGKSALAREAAAQAARAGWSVLRLHATQPARTYEQVATICERLILEDRALLDRIGPPARAVLAQITPLAGPGTALPGPLGRHQVVGAVQRLLQAAFAGRDVLLLVDDAHLLDDADADVLLQIAMAAAPICLLLTLRPLTGDTWLTRGLTRLQRAGVLQMLDVSPLDDDAMQRVVMRAMDEPTAPQTIKRIVEAAQGNPFAALELVHCALAGVPERLPTTVADAIAERMCDVPASTQAVLRWLALAGDEFSVASAEAVAACAGVPAFPALDSALAAGVLLVSDTRYRFRHELVRQALIGQIPPHRRQRMHREIATAMADSDAPAACVAGHWQSGAKPKEALPWWLSAAREAMRLAAFSDALRHLQPVLELQAEHAEALRMRAEALDARGDPAALFAYRLAAQAVQEPARDDLLAKAALAQVKLGDPRGALLVLADLQPASVEGRLCEALAWSGAAALGVADPAIGTAKAAVARRLALQTGDTSSLVIASWAQAAAAHARGELHHSVWADLHETRDMPHLALRVFDGHLCITQRFLYGARPYPEVIAFADAMATEAQRLGAARGLAFGTTLRGEAELLSGDLTAARQHLREGARLHRAIGGPVGEALSLRRLAEVEMSGGDREDALALIEEAMDIARQTDIGFHLLDRIYGTRIQLHGDNPERALHVLEDASQSVRGPLETCPGCRITFAVPAAIAAARAGEIGLAEQHEEQCAYLANVVMRLPAWYAAHKEVQGHLATARGMPREATSQLFSAAAERFRQAGQPLDAARCERLSRE